MSEVKPVGFAGLRQRRSDVSADLASLSREPVRPASAPTPTRTAIPEAQSDGSWKRVAVIGGIAASIVVLWWVGINSSSSPSYSSPVEDPATAEAGSESGYATDTSASAADAAAPAPAPGSDGANFAPVEINPEVNPVSEVAPPVGRGLSLSVDQITYCMSEKVRLEAAQSAVDNAVSSQVDNFNDAVDDYNSRCSNYRYLTSDRERAQAYVDARLGKLRKEGVAITMRPRAGYGGVATEQAPEEPQP